MHCHYSNCQKSHWNKPKSETFLNGMKYERFVLWQLYWISGGYTVYFAIRKERQIMLVPHNSANTNLLWGRRKWIFPVARTAHHGTPHGVMQHSHCWRRPAHSGLTQGPSCHPVLCDLHQEWFVPGQSWLKDRGAFWLCGLSFHRN